MSQEMLQTKSAWFHGARSMKQIIYVFIYYEIPRSAFSLRFLILKKLMQDYDVTHTSIFECWKQSLWSVVRISWYLSRRTSLSHLFSVSFSYIARQRLCKNITEETNMRVTIEDASFYMRSVSYQRKELYTTRFFNLKIVEHVNTNPVTINWVLFRQTISVI
jgi:hypothetical protein